MATKQGEIYNSIPPGTPLTAGYLVPLGDRAIAAGDAASVVAIQQALLVGMRRAAPVDAPDEPDPALYLANEGLPLATVNAWYGTSGRWLESQRGTVAELSRPTAGGELASVEGMLRVELPGARSAWDERLRGLGYFPGSSTYGNTMALLDEWETALKRRLAELSATGSPTGQPVPSLPAWPAELGGPPLGYEPAIPAPAVGPGTIAELEPPLAQSAGATDPILTPASEPLAAAVGQSPANASGAALAPRSGPFGLPMVLVVVGAVAAVLVAVWLVRRSRARGAG